MASAIFPKGKEHLLQTLDMNAADVRVMLVASAYVYDAADEFVADLGAVDNGRSGPLAGKTFTAGVFDAADSTLNATAAVESDALILFAHTGDDATARLIAYIDDVEGLPFTPETGQACPLSWSNDVGKKIFRL